LEFRWHYIYVIVFPELDYKFYYGSRVTHVHPEADNYWGSPQTFKRYWQRAHPEYQTCAYKIILWQDWLPRTKESSRLLHDREVVLIQSALSNVAHLGPSICLNRAIGGRFCLTATERQEHYDKLAQQSAKTYFFVDPTGKTVVVHNLRAFCRKFNLHKPNMTSVHTGKRKSHKGWRKATPRESWSFIQPMQFTSDPWW
jgi:hypothetical protein